MRAGLSRCAFQCVEDGLQGLWIDIGPHLDRVFLPKADFDFISLQPGLLDMYR